MSLLKKAGHLAVVAGLVVLASCGGGGGGGSSYGPKTSPSILASEFVNSLNNVDLTYTSQVMLYAHETLRSQVPGQEQWFVIWDAKFGEYKAVSLEYIRSIVYYDYYSNNNAVASEFRYIERNDVLAGNVNGDFFGDDYEVVDRLLSGYYSGRRSGFLYNDDMGGKHTGSTAKRSGNDSILRQAAKISGAYGVSPQAALSMVSLAKDIEVGALKRNGSLTDADLAATTEKFSDLTGISLTDLQNADTAAEKEALLETAAAHLGSTPANIEQKLLPSMGIEL